jgi:tryptophanyl-tRNA synthetase
LLEPIRLRRADYARDPAEVLRLIAQGTEEARAHAAATLARVRGVFGLSRMNDGR